MRLARKASRPLRPMVERRAFSKCSAFSTRKRWVRRAMLELKPPARPRSLVITTISAVFGLRETSSGWGTFSSCAVRAATRESIWSRSCA